MDGVTLTNLDVLLNSSSATTEGTLLHCLQHCYTAFGRSRLTEFYVTKLVYFTLYFLIFFLTCFLCPNTANRSSANTIKLEISLPADFTVVVEMPRIA